MACKRKAATTSNSRRTATVKTAAKPKTRATRKAATKTVMKSALKKTAIRKCK